MNFTFKDTEEKIKKYYESLRVIEGLKHRLEVYRKRKADIERKIDNSIIRLAADFKAVNYNKAGGSSGGVKTSPQEKAVDKAFSLLEKNLEEVKVEILFIEEQISGIETENADMEYILKGIKLEYKNILESIYRYNKGTLQTSMNCNMDKSTVSRRKDKAIKDVMKWLNFYN